MPDTNKDSQRASLPANRAARDRPVTAVLLALVVGAGLLSRAYPEVTPAFVLQHVGDALWAMMIFLLLALIWPRLRTMHLLVASYLVCVAVECSQLYQAEWILAVRANPLGALVLGHGFLWSDLLAYGAGVAIGAAMDAMRLAAHHRH